MININEIREGDTVVFRNGGRSVATRKGEFLFLLGVNINYTWRNDGRYIHTTDLDIIAIEKKPEPKKLVRFIGVDFYNNTIESCVSKNGIDNLKCQIWKLTFTEGQKPTIEAVEVKND